MDDALWDAFDKFLELEVDLRGKSVQWTVGYDEQGAYLSLTVSPDVDASRVPKEIDGYRVLVQVETGKYVQDT